MFIDSPNKQTIRQQWDLPILRAAMSRLGSPLSYFGMPGAEIVDLLDWTEVLQQKTCVQIVRRAAKEREEDLEILRKMKSNLMIRGVENWQVLRGAVEDIIIKGYDLDRNTPLRSSATTGDVRLQYSLYNLDFLGGIAYKAPKHDATSKSHRVRAIESLFARQRGSHFTLMLTVNVRDTFGLEPAKFFEEEAARANSKLLTETSQWLQNLDSGNKHHLLRHWIPLWIRSISEMQGFKCHCFAPVFYVGHESARMVHFVFDFEFVEGRELRVASEQSAEAVVQLPFLGVENSQFSFLAASGDPTLQSHGAISMATEEQILSLSIRTNAASAAVLIASTL
jgi:hypothetical protein